ncbi:pyridoxamine 5'-phosphate oxidase family protein [Portibacter marinus]|uniref:pyridoxamine 5'-phosphate oxidase family protein n=1 Tax=Portibacter marinus TaxID=2898660 RepID=UPI001F2F311C|nr:pyridoxamine 5'-phosphate oxidase family protein [Portibacter marinus]
MGDIKPLSNKDAIKKIQDMTGGGTMMMFCCDLENQPFHATPMSTQKVEDNGIIWFFSAADSERNQILKRDPKTQLLIVDDGSSNYLSLYGKTEFVDNQEKIEELWSPMVKTWFPEGPTDPNLSLLKFVPQEGFYWDTKHGKLVAMAKMLASVVTGKTMDDSVEGELKV